MVDLGLAKAGQDPQEPQRLLQKRDKNTNVCDLKDRCVEEAQLAEGHFAEKPLSGWSIN